LYNLTPARRIYRLVRGEKGKMKTRLVLQSLVARGNCAPAYALTNILVKKPKTGVSLFSAMPLIAEDAASTCLVSSGATVVVKVRMVIVDHSLSSTICYYYYYYIMIIIKSKS